MSPVVRIQPATGLDTESALEYVAATSAPTLRNLLPHKPGKLVRRGSFTNTVAFTTNGAGPVIGPWWFDDKIVFAAPDAGGATKAHFATMNADGTITYGGNTVPPNPSYPRLSAHARVGDFVYGPATLAVGGDAILKWDGTLLAAGIATTSGAVYPQQGSDYANFAERLFVLNGTVPGTTTPVLNNRLYWSDPGGPTALTLAQWQDDVSGLVNQLVLPDPGVALVAMPSVLGIFCKNSVHVLTGSGSSNFSRKQALFRGATNRDAVCPYGEGAYFLSRDGVFYFDGAQERKVSEAVESKTTQINGVAMTGYIRDAGNGYLYVGVYDNGTPRWQGLYHTKTGAWTEFSVSSTVVTSGVPTAVAANNGWVVMLDKKFIFNASSLTSPTSSVQDSNGTNSAAIDSQWTTRVIRLGTPFNKAHVRRIIIDYAFPKTGVASNAWDYVVSTAPLDPPASPGTDLASGTLPAAANSTTSRRRAVIEVHAEAEDLWLTLSSNSIIAGVLLPELYDVWVEYDVAQQSRGY